MLYVKAFHIIALVAWFSGLFYLPRLFVYHADSSDAISITRFKTMERRLYYAITWPAALLTTILGMWLLTYNWDYYVKAGWMHAKFGLILLVWAYHLGCGHFLRQFSSDNNKKTALFFRVYNEVPTLLLIVIIILVVVKP